MRISDWSSDVCSSDLAKHGALTGANGRVEVSWTQEAEGSDDRRFRLTWTESGGDSAVVAPDRTSFGTLLMERSVKNNLGGTIERRWEPGGLIVDITLRSEEHTSEIQSLMRTSYAVFCLKKK